MAKQHFHASRTWQAEIAKAHVGCGKNGKKKRRVLLRLAARDGKVCHWCHSPVRWSWEVGMHFDMLNAASFDHIKTAESGEWVQPE